MTCLKSVQEVTLSNTGAKVSAHVMVEVYMLHIRILNVSHFPSITIHQMIGSIKIIFSRQLLTFMTRLRTFTTKVGEKDILCSMLQFPTFKSQFFPYKVSIAPKWERNTSYVASSNFLPSKFSSSHTKCGSMMSLQQA